MELIDRKNNQILSVINYEGETQLNKLLSSIGFETNEILKKVYTGSVPVGTQYEYLNAVENAKDLISAHSQASPIFTVIPSSDLFLEVPFALKIEEQLLRLGLTVIRPPTPRYKQKSISLSKTAAQADSSNEALRAASTTRIESFWEYDQTPAHIIVRSSFYGKTIKIIDNATNEVLNVLKISSNQSQSTNLTILRDALTGVGLKIDYSPSVSGNGQDLNIEEDNSRKNIENELEGQSENSADQVNI